jgi:tripartite-type tricarboxylate transporter receptor subunit TctC
MRRATVNRRTPVLGLMGGLAGLGLAGLGLAGLGLAGLGLAGLGLAGLRLSWPAMAQQAAATDYPSRAVTIVVPLAAGTGMDFVVRLYADELQKSLGKPVVVTNQPGAALMLAPQTVARAAADGHTLVVASAPAMAVNPTLYKTMNFDAANDFVPIALYAKSPFLLMVNPASGITSLKDYFAKAATSTPKAVNYATSGVGTIQHLAMEILKKHYKVEAEHVPYRQSPQIVTDLVGGHVDSAVSETGAAITLVQSGKATALAITSATAHPKLGDVPTVAAAAALPEFEAVSWHVLMAPSATPQPIVARLIAEMNRIAASPDFQKKVLEIGLIPVAPPYTVAGMQKYMQDERTRWGAVVTSLGLAGSQ